MSGLDELDRRSRSVAQRKRTVPKPLHPATRGTVADAEPAASPSIVETVPAAVAATVPQRHDEPPAPRAVPDGLGALHPLQIVADDATREALATLKARAGSLGIATNQSALMRWALVVAVDDHGVDGFLERIKSAPRRRPGPQRG